MTPPSRGRRRVLWTVVVVAVVGGVSMLALGLRAQVSAPVAQDAGRIDTPRQISSPEPPPAGAPTARASARSGQHTAEQAPSRAPLTASPPRTIAIPALGIRSRVNPIGLAEDGSIAVPQPGPREDQAAWFDKSPTPGQPGPSIIEGHVDTEDGPSVFFELGRIEPGQRILVTRADGTRLRFVVDAVRNYLKSKFPTETVYGAKDLSTPALRLITCSQFDQATRHHLGNEVVFAHLSHIDGHPYTP